VNVTNPRTQARKSINFNYKTNGIIALKKHVDVDLFIFYKFFEEVNNL
jgi:hypothetical protein